jgi:hypothetical protein
LLYLLSCNRLGESLRPPWWSRHAKGFESRRLGFQQDFEWAHSALIEDLGQRGLLDSTLVSAWGEFGRTPRGNDRGGRDHYSNVIGVAPLGGPVKWPGRGGR